MLTFDCIKQILVKLLFSPLSLFLYMILRYIQFLPWWKFLNFCKISLSYSRPLSRWDSGRGGPDRNTPLPPALLHSTTRYQYLPHYHCCGAVHVCATAHVQHVYSCSIALFNPTHPCDTRGHETQSPVSHQPQRGSAGRRVPFYRGSGGKPPGLCALIRIWRVLFEISRFSVISLVETVNST